MKSKLIISILVSAALLLSLLLYNYAVYGQTFWQRVTAPVVAVSQSDQLKTVKKKYVNFIRSVGEYRDCVMRNKPCTDEQIAQIKQGVIGLVGALAVIGVAAYGYKKYKQRSIAVEPEPMTEKKLIEYWQLPADADLSSTELEELTEEQKVQMRKRRRKPVEGSGVFSEEQRRQFHEKPSQSVHSMEGADIMPAQEGISQQQAASSVPSSLERSWMEVPAQEGWQSRKVTIESDYPAASQFLNRVKTRIDQIAQLVPNVTISSDPVEELKFLTEGMPTSVFKGISPEEKEELKKQATEVVDAMRQLIQKINISVGAQGVDARTAYEQQRKIYEANLAKSNVGEKFNLAIDTIYDFLGNNAQQKSVYEMGNLIKMKTDQLESTGSITKQDIANLGRQLKYLFGIEGLRIIDPQAKERYDTFLQGENVLAQFSKKGPKLEDVIALIDQLQNDSIKLFDIEEKLKR